MAGLTEEQAAAQLGLRGRVPSHSYEAECAVLSGLLLDPEGVWDRVGGILQAEDFYDPRNRLVYESIASLMLASRGIDVVSVWEHLERRGVGDEVGGALYVNEMAQYSPSSAGVVRHAEIVRDRALRRRVAYAGAMISEAAFATGDKGAKEILQEAEQQIFKLSAEGGNGTAGSQPIDDLVVQMLDMVQERADSDRDLLGIGTGLIDLNKVTSGLQPADLIVLAARPSMGKTALAMQIAEHVAIEEGLPVAVFSLEMSAAQLMLRMTGSRGRIDQGRLRRGKLTDEEWSRLAEVVESLRLAKLDIDETPGITIAGMRSECRRIVRRRGEKLGLIVVDYIQLMGVSAGMAKENRATAVGELSRGLKMLGKEFGCPVIALSQLSRGVESRTDKRPMMSDLRESGAIEQDADVIMFLYRPSYYNKEHKNPGETEIILAKQRNGPTTTVRAEFLAQYTRFENAAYGSQDDQ